MDVPLERSVDRTVRVLVCDVARARPDAVTVEALARLCVAARRRGYRLRICNASTELCELIEFMGLCSTLRASVDTLPSVETGR